MENLTTPLLPHPLHSGKGEEREVLDAQVEEFNTLYDDIKVEAVRLPEGSYNEQVSAAALAGEQFIDGFP